LFEDIDENKLCYTEIHNKYVHAFFFLDLLFYRNKNDALDGEVFEMLITFTDFMAFKELMIDYKKVILSFHVHSVFVTNKSPELGGFVD
uniref:ADP-ribosylation factor-like protein 2-binding protein n=1 Tax=Schistocephalus solidus TaxID=70667 RepID=A0A183T2H5_SCHSO